MEGVTWYNDRGNWYDAEGNPQVDRHRFPDLRKMTEKMHGMGLRAGWYMGNYQCGMGKADVPAGGWARLWRRWSIFNSFIFLNLFSFFIGF